MGDCCNKEPEHISLLRYIAILTIVGGIVEISYGLYIVVETARYSDLLSALFKAYVAIIFLFGPIHLSLGLLLWRGVVKRDTNLIRLFLYISTPVYLTGCVIAIALFVEQHNQLAFAEQEVAWFVFKILAMWFFQLGVFWSYKKVVQEQRENATRRGGQATINVA